MYNFSFAWKEIKFNILKTYAKIKTHQQHFKTLKESATINKCESKLKPIIPNVEMLLSNLCLQFNLS